MSPCGSTREYHLGHCYRQPLGNIASNISRDIYPRSAISVNID